MNSTGIIEAFMGENDWLPGRFQVVCFEGTGRYRKGYHVRCLIRHTWTEWMFMGLTQEEAQVWRKNHAKRYGKYMEHGVPWYESI